MTRKAGDAGSAGASWTPSQSSSSIPPSVSRKSWKESPAQWFTFHPFRSRKSRRPRKTIQARETWGPGESPGPVTAVQSRGTRLSSGSGVTRRAVVPRETRSARLSTVPFEALRPRLALRSPRAFFSRRPSVAHRARRPSGALLAQPPWSPPNTFSRKTAALGAVSAVTRPLKRPCTELLDGGQDEDPPEGAQSQRGSHPLSPLAAVLPPKSSS